MAPTTRSTRQTDVEHNSNQSHEGSMDDAAINVQPTNEPGSREKGNKVRGPTFMCKVWGQQDNERVPVSFNDKGQPISNNSTLSHFLGTIARNGKYAPLQYKTWHKMPKVFKEYMFALVQQKFDFSPGHKIWILKSLSKKWRNWKATMKKKYYNPDLPIEEQIHCPPDRVQADQWKDLVEYWHGDAKTISAKNQSSRKGQYILYKKGKTPLAVIREIEAKKLGHDPPRAYIFVTCFKDKLKGNASTQELSQKTEKMKELSAQVPVGEIDSSAPSDVFSQVMGKEKSGSVRMYGLGVCPSDLWGEIPSSGTSYRQAMEWKTELDKTNQKVEELRRDLDLQRSANGANSNIPVNSPILVTSPNIPVTSPNIPDTSPNQHIHLSTSTSQQGRIKVRDDVYFKSVANPTKVVGKGCIKSMDPSAEVGGEELGANWCEIHVLLPIIWDEHLIRPYGGLKTVGDAIGVTIAWPISLVVRDDDDGFIE